MTLVLRVPEVELERLCDLCIRTRAKMDLTASKTPAGYTVWTCRDVGDCTKHRGW